MAVNTRRHRVSRRKRGRVRRLLFSLLLVTALFFFLHSGVFALQTVEVHGNQRVTEAEIVRLAAVEPGLNLWQADIKGITSRVQAHPLIAHAEVTRRWPHTLVITVREREPLALVAAAGDFLVVDGQGYVMERLHQLDQVDLPLISGLLLESDPGPGSRLSAAGLEAVLDVLRQLPPSARQQVVEIEARDPDNLLLYLTGKIKVKFGDSTDVEGKWQRLKEALQGIGRVEGLEYIDVSFAGPPAVRLRQER
ncbi:MAG: cell division protein FtsQ/DivIB [Moorellaceae bacterium]